MASAIVVRDDVPDRVYRIEASEAPYLVDLPGEGHGVLIASRWVVTAAHAISWQPEIKEVMLNGKPRAVARMVVHPGFRKPPQQVLERALETWDWSLFAVHLAESDDIALLQLELPVTDIAPIALRPAGDEYGQKVVVIGKGAKGTGLSGYAFTDSHRTELRRAQNRVTSADGRWFCYVFDRAPDALPREGATGSGDSGGPVLMASNGKLELAGLSSWVAPQGTSRTRPGLYGQVSCNVRLGHYEAWLKDHLGSP